MVSNDFVRLGERLHLLIGQFYLEMDGERAVLSLVRKYETPPPDVSSVQALYNRLPCFQLHLADEFRKKQKFTSEIFYNKIYNEMKYHYSIDEFV